MRRLPLKLCLFLTLSTLLLPTMPAPAQIAGPPGAGDRVYQSTGKTDQPFTIRIVGARRTVLNILLVKLSLTNNGTAPLDPHQDFCGDDNPADNNKISAVYVVDPNGRKKYAVVRDAQNQALCSTIAPPVRPGERRMLYIQLLAPPQSSSTVDLFFPKADPIIGVPMGLPQAGKPAIPGADVVAPAGAVPVANAQPSQPGASVTESTDNNEPTHYTNQNDPVLPNTPLTGIGSVSNSNSTVPFTVDVLSLTAPQGGPATLRLALTNTGSGELDAAGQFNNGSAGNPDALRMSGVYLVDPVSKQRFEVTRTAQGDVAAARLNPPFGAGERRMLEAEFPAIPDTIKSVYVYFPHAAPIADVPVKR